MTVSMLDMRKTLIRKLGFSESSRHHIFYNLYDREGTRVATTKLSHSRTGRDIGISILSKIAKQMHLTIPQLQDAVKCPLSREDYSGILREKGLINTDLP